MFNFVITHVFPGSEKQRQVGIHATFNVNLVYNDQVVVSLRDLKLNKAKSGEYYIGSPYRTYKAHNDQGQDEEKRSHYIKIWPDKANWDKQLDIINAVLKELNKAATPQATNKPVATSTKNSSDAAW